MGDGHKKYARMDQAALSATGLIGEREGINENRPD
jgi:hypothetical protein